MKKIFILAFLLIPFINTSAQVTTLWERRYNGTGNDYDEATSIFMDGTGFIYVAGASVGQGSGEDYVAVKYDANGNTIWTSRYNGPGNGIDDAYLVKADNSGNVYVSGASTGSGSGLDYAVVKYNSSGVQQWVYRYNGPGNTTDEVYSLQVDATGSIYLTGYSNGGSSMDDICTVKLNSSGQELWVKRFNGNANNDDYGNSIQIDNLGNSYVTCACTRTGSDHDYLTIKYDSTGLLVWTVYYNGPGNAEDFPSSNAIDVNGNIYVTGYSVGSGSSRDYCTIKYNNAGVQQWASRYNNISGGWDEAFNVIIDNSGNVYVTGNSAGSGTGDDYCTIKYNNNGVQQWAARYNSSGANDDYCNWVAVDPTGNVYVTGIAGDVSPRNITTIGYNSSGVQQWAVTYNGTGNEFDSGNALAVDNAGNVYVTGGSDNPNNTDFITFKYSSTIGIKTVSSEIPESFSLGQNYPNPFNPKTVISFQCPVFSFVTLKIYDVLGREVATLVNEKLQPGTYETSFDGSKLTSGVYFYKLETSGFSDVKRMMLIK